MCYEENDELPVFIPCFKNKPKDKVVFAHALENKIVYDVLKDYANLKLVFCAETQDLKSSTVYNITTE